MLTGSELTLTRATCVGKKWTSPLARARWKAVETSSGRLAGIFGIFGGAMPSGGAVMVVGVDIECGRGVGIECVAGGKMDGGGKRRDRE